MSKPKGFGHYGPCQHPHIEEVKNGNDQVVGGQCRTCLAVLWGVGRCHGCGKDPAKLTHIVGELRYCGQQCRADELDRTKRKPFCPPPSAGNPR